MTSLDLVEFINSQRAPEDAELRHDHFMVKVPKVLGDEAPKFLGTAFYTNGTGAKVERAIYTFPKRESCLMAMSYSYDIPLRHRVVTRLAEFLHKSFLAKVPQVLGETVAGNFSGYYKSKSG